MQARHLAAETVAEAYLALLKDRGVTRLFVNSGTDFASIVEAYGRQKESGLDFPQVFVCAHENIAISMAHGSFLGDGALQAVMLHTSVGTTSIRRWLRPVSLQDVPDALLPDELRDTPSRALPRRVDGTLALG